MSLRLIKPGMGSVNLVGKIHPKTGKSITPVGYLRNGTAVWPVLGASPDDPDDLGEEDDDQEDEEEEDPKPPRKRTVKPPEDDEDDDDEEDSRVHRASEQAKKYRLRLREKERELEDLKAKVQAIEDNDKTPDEVAARTIGELKEKNSALSDALTTANAQLAFFRTSVPGVTWIDPGDVFALADRAGLFDEVVDEDGNVNERELRRGLKDLAKNKPHLVKRSEDDPKARGRKSKDEEDEEQDDDDEQSSTRPMNGRRRGTKDTASRAALAKRFPVLGRQ